ncbi:argininosuccinate lyase [Phenylobacterium sp. 20VBR1]|uniref:Argininosuccinate lyase n=1 Tax=Phenylobacterium glaciei TaxID=2803784 RepID=A0A941HY06_9CAUL|nr:argininosuccinate lyase [Phenylobacterium glaciei]MBR7620867.1 argininosuccinate lyase [Phenylobacterium glaciei]
MRIERLVLAAVAAFALGSPAVAGDQDFTLVNATGYTLNQVFVSPTRAKDWEEDVLGRDVLADGDRTEITFSRDTDACLWDLKVVYDNGESAEWDALSLCKISVAKISYDRKSGDTSVEVD